ncbi:MAG: aminotransferase class V-fold PLP-dependent enzyme [Acidimicrobiia bacterium]|nr:aminotransferase class V-fold PLP-dependent enzyme [Acidimicrobiia bacterium]
MIPESYAAEFSEGFGYLDHASVGPPSRRVISSVADAYRRIADTEVSVAGWTFGLYESALADVARFLAVTPEQVTVIPTTSDGLFQVAFGLHAAGGNVVVPSHEFPANLYPWLRAESAGGPEVRLVEVPDGRVTAAALSNAVDDETRAISVSLVDYLTGFRVDLAELRELADDALLVVDAIQGLGAVEQTLAPADVLVSGGVKWMRAGWGSGVIAASPTALERLEPTLTGWFGVEDFFDFSIPAPHAPRSDAERLRAGSPPMYGVIAFAAAIEVIELAGAAGIEAAIRDVVLALDDALDAVGADRSTPWRSSRERAGILRFRMPGVDPAETAQALAAAGLVVSRHADWIRLSPHATTDPDVADALTEVLGS